MVSFAQGWIYLSFQDDNHLITLTYDNEHSWIYLSFQDDNHPRHSYSENRICWIYLSFQDDNHRLYSSLLCLQGWIYLSFQDDNHRAGCVLHLSEVGYTFHFKMITTEMAMWDEIKKLDIPFISR